MNTLDNKNFNPSSDDQKPWDLTIIGAGLAGLTAAITSAQAGLKTLLLESGKRAGGRAGTVEKEGALFNLGPHALYKEGVGLKILHQLGIQPQGNMPQGNGKLVTNQGLYPLPFSPSSLLTHSFFNWKDKKEIIRLFSRLSKIDTVPLNHISVKDWANSFFQRDRARQYFFMMCRLSSYSNSPDIASAGAALRQLQDANGGVIYLDGGWQSLVDQMTERALKVGVTIVKEETVHSIAGFFPQMTITTKNHPQPIETRYVVSTINPKATCALMGEKAPASFMELAESLLPIRGASFDLSLKGLPLPKQTFGIHFDQPFYFSSHSHYAKLTKDPSHFVVHVYRYLTTGETLQAVELKKELEHFLDQLQPGWRDRVVTSRFMPQITVTQGLPTASTLSSDPEVHDYPGLYMAGDWLTRDGQLADASISSAQRAIQKILNHQQQGGAPHSTRKSISNV
ncbi:phytoene desaturase family protein [Marininema halotolerans]|uniref:Phytoene dehydrogenase-related protein n=1 Tax=Marininema halotolerans TaxID=1155944 RepID=A0A1I6TP17_9BACL|nr:NAD(P)/FAD-dependent oxidoreductase [Marininema halotolerans]SFS90925.1 Phytoene dehydrogenase-related protein [Marininema halotolerans]